MVQRAKERAKILLEALPYIKRFSGKIVVVKFGGNAMVDEELKKNFALDMILMKYIGINPVVVHGGGPQIGDLLTRLGKESKFVGGMRVTDKETMDVVEMVLVGQVNQEIVGLINGLGGNAVGLSGKDGNLIVGKRIVHTKGERRRQHPGDHRSGQGRGSSEGQHGGAGASLIARTSSRSSRRWVWGAGARPSTSTPTSWPGPWPAELAAEKLILLTDVPGVIRDGQLISSLAVTQARSMMKQGQISGGMIPKVECCISALTKGVAKAHIIDGRLDHSVLLELFTDSGVGTQIVPD